MGADTKTLLTLGLGLTEPWEVKDAKLVVSESNANAKELHIWIDFNRDYLFVSSKGQLLKAYDSVEKTWRHLNFFGSITFRVGNFACKLQALKVRHNIAQDVSPG